MEEELFCLRFTQVCSSMTRASRKCKPPLYCLDDDVFSTNENIFLMKFMIKAASHKKKAEESTSEI